MLKRLARGIRLAVATILVVCLAGFVYLWATSPRYRDYDTRQFLEQQGFKTVVPDAQMRRLIKRAQIDYFLFPEPRPQSFLDFRVAKRKGDLLYLIFRPDWSNSAVVYAYTAATRKPVWRTEVGNDDD